MIKLQALYNYLDFEPFILLSGFFLMTYLFYKIFLKEVTFERHMSIQRQLKNILRHYFIFSTLFVFCFVLYKVALSSDFVRMFLPYLALFSFFGGTIVFIKTSRLFVLQYLFLSSMEAGVPILIVNIFSLLLTIVIIVWGASSIFGIQLAPLLATSAAFSIILGMALQDTLGNLFAGISLQIDKTYVIGDWLEVFVGPQKIVGKVQEITWRSAILIGWTEEKIVIPNRVMANAQISNFSNGDRAILRNQIFRLPLGVDIEKVKYCLLKSIKSTSNVLQQPPPSCLIAESTDSWLLFKLFYHINDYSTQLTVATEVLSNGLEALADEGFSLAHQIYEIQSQED